MKVMDLPQHHAILLESSNRNALSGLLFSELQSLSPAHRFFNQTVLSMDNAREIISWAQTPYSEEKIAILSFHTIGLEAQNALLKLFEEPKGVRFILITGNIGSLIGTVLSRVHLIKEKDSLEKTNDAELFLSTSHGLRMKLPCVVNIISRVDEEDRKDREGVRAFILSLIAILEKKSLEQKYIQKTLQTASYASDPSASGKALLEYLALLLPQTSR